VDGKIILPGRAVNPLVKRPRGTTLAARLPFSGSFLSRRRRFVDVVDDFARGGLRLAGLVGGPAAPTAALGDCGAVGAGLVPGVRLPTDLGLVEDLEQLDKGVSAAWQGRVFTCLLAGFRDRTK